MVSPEDAHENLPEPPHVLVLWHVKSDKAKQTKSSQLWKYLMPIQEIATVEDETLRLALARQRDELTRGDEIITCPYSTPSWEHSFTITLRRDDFLRYSGIDMTDEEQQNVTKLEDSPQQATAGNRISKLLGRFRNSQ